MVESEDLFKKYKPISNFLLQLPQAPPPPQKKKKKKKKKISFLYTQQKKESKHFFKIRFFILNCNKIQ